MNSSALLLIVALGIIVFALFSGANKRSVLTTPLAFTLLGAGVGVTTSWSSTIDPASAPVHVLAEATLVLLLFTDAARIDARRLRRDHSIPLRMLLVGLPLSIVLGAALALWLPLGLGLAEAALLAAILAPTDVALGQSVVDDERVPQHLRQAISVESGLNDGLVVPFVLLCVGMVAMASGASDHAGPVLDTLASFTARQIGFGVLVGAAIGWSGASLIKGAVSNERMDESFEGAAIIALIVTLFAAAELLGGNGLVAAFVGGLLYGYRTGGHCGFVLDFIESEGRLLTIVIFFLFGATMVPQLLDQLDWPMLVFAVLALTLVRTVAIAVSLVGAKACASEVIFLGWFGPRGLASILFTLLVAEELGLPMDHPILLTAILTVALSVLMHGVSAAPLAERMQR